jgi:hypothetical protein
LPDLEPLSTPLEGNAIAVEESEEQFGEPVRRGRWWLTAAFLLLLCILGFRAGGDAIYDPPARLPDPRSFTRDQNLLGATSAVLDEFEAMDALAAAGFELTGDAYEIAFPRTLADRLFGERREQALVFTAQTEAAGRRRFLLLTDGKSSPVYAVESYRSRPTQGPAGIFIAIPSERGFQDLIAGLAALGHEARALRLKEHDTGEYTLFGPFAGGNHNAIQEQIAGNVVLGHLVESLDGNRADISMAAGLFLITRSREGGTIRAVYQPSFGVILEPPWESSQTSTLAHELVHAYMDEVAREPSVQRELAARHFEDAHPRFFGEVLSERYERLDARGRAEEAMANIVGALAAGEISTVPAAAILSGRAWAEISEPILTTDVVLLAEFGLLPECMSPESLGYDLERVTFVYHDLVSDHCSRP